MPRRKVTFVYDPERRRNMCEPQPLEEVVAGWVGVWDVTVEELPDPLPRNTYKIIIERDLDSVPLSAGQVWEGANRGLGAFVASRVLFVERCDDA